MLERRCYNVVFCGFDYFNRINFREIKFRDFENFCLFREKIYRENMQNGRFSKINPREIFKVVTPF